MRKLFRIKSQGKPFEHSEETDTKCKYNVQSTIYYYYLCMASKFLTKWSIMAIRNVVFAYDLLSIHERWTMDICFIVFCVPWKLLFNKRASFEAFQQNCPQVSVIPDEYHCYLPHWAFFRPKPILRFRAKITEETFCYVMHVLHSELIAF